MQSLCTLRIYVVYLSYFALQPHKRSIEESTAEEMPKKRQCSDREEDKDKQTYGITGFVSVCKCVWSLLLFCSTLDTRNVTKGEDGDAESVFHHKSIVRFTEVTTGVASITLCYE